MTDSITRVEAYKEIYYYELSRKLEVAERLKWLLSIWIILVGAVIFCSKHYYKVPSNLNELFSILIISAVVFILLCAFLLGICFKEKNYAYISAPSDIEDYLSENPDEDFNKLFIEMYCKAYNNNFKKNNEIIRHLVDCTHVMILSAILLLFSFLCIVPNWVEKEEPVQKIQILESGE